MAAARARTRGGAGFAVAGEGAVYRRRRPLDPKINSSAAELSLRSTVSKKSPPSFATAGSFGARGSPAPVLDAIPARSVWKKKAETLRDDLCGHLTEAFDAQRTGCGGREIEHTATHIRTAIVDRDDDAAVAMGHAQFGAERQRTMGAGHGVLIEPLARGGLAAGLVAVEGGNAGEAVSAGGLRHRIGIAPGLLRRALGRLVRIPPDMVDAMLAMVAAGPGRNLGHG